MAKNVDFWHGGRGLKFQPPDPDPGVKIGQIHKILIGGEKSLFSRTRQKSAISADQRTVPKIAKFANFGIFPAQLTI